MHKIAGMDDAAREKDCQGYKTTIDMVTGGGSKDIESEKGPEVIAPGGDSPLSKKGKD